MKRLISLVALVFFLMLVPYISQGAYPTTTEHHKLYPYTSVMASPYSCDNTGVIDIAASIESIKANQSNVGTIYFPHGTYKLATNLTIPVGIRIEREAGAKISISTGVTLTYNGDLQETGEPFFTLNGTAQVDFSSNTILKEIPLGTWPITVNTTFSNSIKIPSGCVFSIATGITLTINDPIDAGLYQIFSCTGTGAVAGLKRVNPEWFGAVGDGSIDDTAALNSAVTATTAGGVIYVNGTYKTTGCLVQKSLSLVSTSPYLFQGSAAYGFKAAGAQAYVLKFLGVFAGTAFIHPYLQNINIDGGDQAISDAALVMDCCNFGYLDRPSIQNVDGHGVRLRTCWETRIINPYIGNCGTVDTGSAFFIDGPSPFDASYGTNNLRVIGGTWGANRGRWIDVSNLANLDVAWIEDNKFELDNATTPNTANTSVIYLGAASRTQVLNNTFHNFGVTSDKYANLIYIGGHATEAAQRGSPSNRVWGNRASAANPTSGAINGLYLDTYAPTCEEGENTFVSYNGEVCPNVNVSQYPQLINLTWRNQSGSLYPNMPLPDRELAGFLSIHKVARGTYAIPFVADADVINNAQTALQLAAADQAHSQICHLYDLSRFVGSSTKHVVVRVRMRLDAAGSVTVYANPSNPGWAGVPIVVNSTTWAWHEFIFPASAITATNHLLDIFHWAINTGTPKLLVDGIEFDTTNVIITTVTTGSPTLAVTGILPRITYIDSSGGAVTPTLPDGTDIGQRQIIIMTDATTSSTVSVTHHTTSDPEVFTFAVLGAYLELEWDGTDWVTIVNHGATT